MRICRAALAVAFRHPVYLLVYTVFLSCMGVFLTMGVTSDAAEDTVFEPARARIAVVDRDGSPVAAALERYLGTRSDLVPLADDAFALQDALAQSRVGAVVIVPAGYGDDLLAAARDGAAPADGASAGTASVDGMSTELPSVQIAYGTYNEASALVEEEAGRFCSLVAASAALDPTALVDEALSRAETAAAERAVTTVTATEATSSAADPLIAYLSFSAYTIACSVVVCAGLVLSRFGAPDIRRRTAASPARPVRMSAELLLAGVVIVVGVWAVSGAVGVASSGALAA